LKYREEGSIFYKIKYIFYIINQ